MNHHDYIFLKDIELHIIIGVHSHEQVRRQKVNVSLKLYTTTHTAAHSDQLKHALNYETLQHNIRHLGEKQRFHLIEAFAHTIAQHCFAQTSISAVEVTVAKEWVLPYTHSVGVVIYRTKKDFPQLK